MLNIVKDLEFLRKPCEEVTDKINYESMAYALKNTLAEAIGAGLAANQIHLHHKICLINVTVPIFLVNPVIVKAQYPKLFEERCLSLPGLAVVIERYNYVKVKALDEHLRKVKYTFRGVEAQCAQHEIDHLNGILMIDHLKEEDRARAERHLALPEDQRRFIRIP